MAELKKINFELIEPGSAPYEVLGQVRLYHGEISEAKIAIAWRENLKADKDGHLILGKCIKASDLQRELAEYDFVILLNREVWEDPEFTDAKKLALVDHELCHAAVAVDKDNVPRRDERGRLVWRTRRHDIEEFRAIVQRHGCYKKDLELFADALIKKRKTPLLNDNDDDATTYSVSLQ